MSELSKRAVKAQGWRWIPGMLVRDRLSAGHRSRVLHADGMLVDAVDVTAGRTDSFRGRFSFPASSEAAYPDLEDPATLGCVERLVCLAHSGAVQVRFGVDVMPDMSGKPKGWWRVVDAKGRSVARGHSLAPLGESVRAWALVEALEAAPCEGGQ